MAILPYMKQLPRDFYSANYPAAEPVEEPIPEAPPATVWPSQPESIVPPVQTGGVWYGANPPISPTIGWMWLNTTTNGLYIYTDPGVWEQIGTNW